MVNCFKNHSPFFTLMVAFFCLLMSARQVHADSLFFSTLSLREGLPSNIISAVAQDKYDFIWIGTANGLARYDGYHFKTFHKTQSPGSLSFNSITSLIADEDVLWVGTRKGLYKIDVVSFEISKVDTDEHLIVRTLYKDREHTIWVGTATGLLRYRRESDNFVTYTAENSHLSHNTVRSIYQDKQGNVWVGTYDQLSKLPAGQNTFVTYDLKGNYKPSLRNNLVCDIKSAAPDTDTLLWVGTETGLCLFNTITGTYRHFSEKNVGFSNDVIKNIYVDEENKLWLGTDFGLNIFDPEHHTNTVHFHNPQVAYSIGNNVVWQIFEDRGGVLWFVTSNGISRLNKYKSFYAYHEVSHQIHHQNIGNQVKSILITQKGVMWLATLHGAIRIDPDTNQRRIFDDQASSPHKILLNNVFALEEDTLGRIWIGTAGGINIWDETKQKMYSITATAKKGLNTNYIGKFTKGPDGSFWVTAWDGGFFKVTGNFEDPDKMHFLMVDDFPSEKNVADTHAIWTVQHNELFRIDLYSFKKEKVPAFNKVANRRNINCLFLSEKGILWAGTQQGLIEYKPKQDSAVFFPVMTGNDINLGNITEDKAGNIWGAMNHSIVKLDIHNHNVIMFPLDRDIPLKSFFYGCTARKPNGEIYFGGDNGYISLIPEKIYPNNFQPKVYVTSLEINNKPVTHNEAVDEKILLADPISFTRHLVLDYAQRSLTFGFSALHYWQPSMNIYAYKLEGFDEDWQYVSGAKNFAVYSNLSPRKYTLKVKGTNNYGIWSNEIAVLHVEVKPPLFLSKGFIILYVVMGLLAIYGGLRIYSARMTLKNDLKLMRLEKEHAEEIVRTKQQFFTNISHELRTPISLILPPIHEIMKRDHLGEESTRLITLAEKNAQRLLRVVNQILDFRKLEDDILHLKVSQVDIVDFCQEIHGLFTDRAARNGIDFSFHTDVNECRIWVDLEKIETVFFNLLSNALKFTRKGGKVDFSISLHEQHKLFPKGAVAIQVIDSGIGIAPEEQAKIFERFYQTLEAKRMHSGTGIGLTLAAEYVKLHHGRLTVSSTPGKQTCFTVTLPLGKAHFPIDSIYEDQEIDLVATRFLHIQDDLPKNYRFDLASDKPLLLIVENNSQMIDFIRISLKDKYNFVVAENGEEGLKKAHSFYPAIIISDIMMPVMDGLTFCQKMKENPKTRHIPLILLTAKSLTSQKIEGIRMGADSYITKPFDIELLEAHIDHLIRRKQELSDYFKNEILIQPSSPAVQENGDDKFIRKVINIIEANISNPDFSVEMLSSEVGMSATHLYRKLKSLTHLTTHEIIKKYRLKKASLLLKNNEGNISEIMYDTGFSSLSYFSKCFKAEFGMTPKDYQQQMSKSTIDIENELDINIQT